MRCRRRECEFSDYQHPLGVTASVDLSRSGSIDQQATAQGTTGFMYRAEMNIRHSRPIDFQLIID
jgi:hypothetical protein